MGSQDTFQLTVIFLQYTFGSHQNNEETFMQSRTK